MNDTKEPATFVAKNHVQVNPGGAVFTSIGAALASIDPSESNQYTVLLGVGTYEEQVTFKSYVHMKGPERGTATIRWAATEAEPTAVLGASNSSLQYVTISASGSDATKSVGGISLGDGSFSLGNCAIFVSDGGVQMTNLTGVFIDPPTGSATVDIVNSTVSADATSPNTPPIAVSVTGNAAVTLDNVVVATSGDAGIGFQGAGTSYSQLEGCSILGETWSVFLVPDTSASITAQGCTLTGPVSPGVNQSSDENRRLAPARITDEASRASALDVLTRFSRQMSLLPPSDVVPPQTAVVQPGNQSFSSITAALESITNASLDNTYQVRVGPGTYMEQVFCKSWVAIIGPQDLSAIITFTPSENTDVVPIVTGAAYAAIKYVSIRANGSPTSKELYGASVTDGGPFYIEHCQIYVSDGGSPQELIGGVNVSGANASTGVGMVDCVVNVRLTSLLSVFAWGVFATGRSAFVDIGQGSLTTSSPAGLPIDGGGFVQNHAQMRLTSVTVTSVGQALGIGSGGGSIGATSCSITGPIGPGVIVTPAPAAADAAPGLVVMEIDVLVERQL